MLDDILEFSCTYLHFSFQMQNTKTLNIMKRFKSAKKNEILPTTENA